jgi:molybdopterin converting factor subunit 1
LRVRILYFAQAREARGKSEEILDFQGSSVKELLSLIGKENPSLGRVLKSCSVALNMKILKDFNKKLSEGDEVAILPPVAGG